MMATFIATVLIAMARGEIWSALLWGLIAGLGGLTIYLLVTFIWNLLIAPRRIREEEERFFSREVLEYALENSGLKDRSKIETELRKAALRKKITIEVQHTQDSITFDVSPDKFEEHAIDLDKDHIYRFRGEGKGKLLGIGPMFRGREIRKLWKKKKKGKPKD